MKSRSKSILSLLIMTVMVLSLFPLSVLNIGAENYSGTFTKYTGEPTEGYYIIVGPNSKDVVAMSAEKNGIRISNATITIKNDQITDPDAMLVWKIEETDNGWTIYNENQQKYAASTGTRSQGDLLADGTDNKAYWSWGVNSKGGYNFINIANDADGKNAYLKNNGTLGFACYAGTFDGTITLYKLDAPVAPGCDHNNWDEGSVSKEPTCTEKGVKTYKCNECENTKTEPIDALGHDWNEGSIAKNPTCTEAGVRTFTCSRCSETKTEPIDAHGHNFDDGVCTRCCATLSEVTSTLKIEKTGKANDSTDISSTNVASDGGLNDEVFSVTGTKGTTATRYWRTDGTIRGYSNGTLTIQCLTGNISSIKVNYSASGFKVGETTATSSGQTFTINSDTVTIYFTGSARITSIDITYETIGESKHTFGEWHIDKYADCETKGTKHHVCDVCGITESEEIPEAHTFNDWSVLETATCTKDGARSRTCSKCGHVENEVIPAHHTLVKIVEEAPADCSEVGHFAHWHCTVCDKLFDSEECVNELTADDCVYKLNHTLSFDENDNPICSVCNKAMTNDDILDIAFSLTDGQSMTQAISITGKVTMINTAYDSSYKNITVTILVDGTTRELMCYRLKGDGVANLAICDVITVNGTIKNYNGTIEFDSGCTATTIVKDSHTDADHDLICDDCNESIAPIENEYFHSVSLNIGKDLTVNFYTENTAGKTMKFVLNGVEYDAVEGIALENGLIKYSFKGLAPHNIEDDITAILCNASGTEINNGSITYSVEDYLYELLEQYQGNTALEALVYSISDFADASKDYVTDNAEAIAKDDNGVFDEETAKVIDADAKTVITGVSAYYDNTVRLVFDYTAVEANINVADIKFIFNDKYIVTDAISALNFDTEYTVSVTVGGNTYSVNYSVNDYLVAIYKFESTSNVMKNLALATYNYGVAAKAYIATLNI